MRSPPVVVLGFGDLVRGVGSACNADTHGRFDRGNAVGLRQLIRSTLELPEGRRLSRTLERLGHLSHGDCGTKRIQTTVREFLNGLQHYRAYLMHPQLGLPRTTNTVESMCRLLRELLRSSRAGSNPASVLLWATALIRMRPRVACNGHSFNRIN